MDDFGQVVILNSPIQPIGEPGEQNGHDKEFEVCIFFVDQFFCWVHVKGLWTKALRLSITV